MSFAHQAQTDDHFHTGSLSRPHTILVEITSHSADCCTQSRTPPCKSECEAFLADISCSRSTCTCSRYAMLGHCTSNAKPNARVTLGCACQRETPKILFEPFEDRLRRLGFRHVDFNGSMRARRRTSSIEALAAQLAVTSCLAFTSSSARVGLLRDPLLPFQSPAVPSANRSNE